MSALFPEYEGVAYKMMSEPVYRLDVKIRDKQLCEKADARRRKDEVRWILYYDGEKYKWMRISIA